MSEIDDVLNSGLIDLYYSSAVSGIKEEWLKNLDEKWYQYISNLSDKEKVTYHVALLDEEVAHGGFNQYFASGFGQFAKDTINSLKLINANKSALILEKAYEYVNKRNLDDAVFRKKLLLNEIEELYNDEDLDDALIELDNEYSDYEDNIAVLLNTYLSSNTSDT